MTSWGEGQGDLGTGWGGQRRQLMMTEWGREERKAVHVYATRRHGSGWNSSKDSSLFACDSEASSVISVVPDSQELLRDVVSISTIAFNNHKVFADNYTISEIQCNSS